MNLNQWMQEQSRFVRLLFVVLAALNGYSAYHIFFRSPLFAVIQGIAGILLLLTAIFTPFPRV